MGKYQARIAGGRDPRQGRPRPRQHGRRAPGDLHRPAGVRRGADRGRGARARARTCERSTYGTGDVAGAYTSGNGITGTSKLVVDEARGVVVGATFTGPGVQELLHSATVAIAGEVPLDRLWHAVPSFPTISEVWLRLLETYGL